MDLKDATPMMLSESADHPAVASIAQSALARPGRVAVSFKTARGASW